MATRKEQFDATQAAIIQAGLELLSQDEVKNVSVSEIMKRCSLSPGLFYHYYKSKDAFIAFLATKTWEETMSILDDDSIPYLRRPRVYCEAALHVILDVDPQLHRNLNAYRMTDAYVEQREKHYENDVMFRRMCKYFFGCIEKKAFSPELPVEFISNLYVYVVHGINLNASLYKREWNGWEWCEEFFTYAEEKLLRPYYLLQT